MTEWERALVEIARAPGILDVEALGARLWPWSARRPQPYRSWAERAAELELRAQDAAAQRAHAAQAKRRATNLCRELTRRGLVMPAVHYRLDARTAELVRANGLDWLRPFTIDEERPALTILDGEPPTGHARAILSALLEGPVDAGTLRDTTGGRTPAGKPLGAWARALARLVDDGTVVPPSHRWPTLRGRTLAAERAGLVGGAQSRARGRSAA